MGFLKQLLGKSEKDSNELQKKILSPENHVKKAGEIMEKILFKSWSGEGISMKVWTVSEIDEIIEEIEKAIKLNSSNPEFQYLLACLLQAKLKGAEAEIKLKEIVTTYPGYAQAEGHLKNRENWFTPFMYQGWSENHKNFDEELIPKSQYAFYLVPIRVGVRRIISFFAWFPKNRIDSFNSNQRATIRFSFMKTPFCPLVSAYALIETNPVEPFTLENILQVDSYRSEWSDYSRSGYWLIRLLSQQDFTFFVIADPDTSEVYFNRAIQFDSKAKADLNFVIEQIKNIEQIETTDESLFYKAREFYENNFSLDNIKF
jgi:hypothetical protein